MQNGIKIEGTHFCITDTDAIDLNKNKVYSKEMVLDYFKDKCVKPGVENVIYEIDKNELGQSKEGITVFRVQPKDENIMALYYYESSYEKCKDEIASLSGIVLNTKKRIEKRNKEQNNRKKQIVKRVAGATIVIAGTIAAIAGGYKLYKSFNTSFELNTLSPEQQEMIDESNKKYEEEKAAQRQIENEQIKQQEEQQVDYYNQQMEQIRDFGSDTMIPIEQYNEEKGYSK